MPLVDTTVYEVLTDLDPQELSAVGLEVFRRWTEFALGGAALNGRMIKDPTGRYASSVQFKQRGPTRVAIFADPKVAPEAIYLETGHGPVDLWRKLQKGRVYPMHRGAFGTVFVGPNNARGRRFWARARAGGFNGYARVPMTAPQGTNTSGRGPAWSIPSMVAYSPAKIIAELVAQQIQQGVLP